MNTLDFKFPADFLWGTANSAYQCEGFCTSHDIYQWGIEKDFTDANDITEAVQHYKKYEEDIEMIANLPTNSIKLSLEWARLEPSPGKYDRNEFDHYRHVLETIKKHKLKIILVIHHFSNPSWIWDIGGWEKNDIVTHFIKLVQRVVQRYYDLVDYWIPINEPNYYAAGAYFLGEFPPGKRNNIPKALIVQQNMALAHVKAYNILRTFLDGKGYKDVKITCASHFNIIEPWRENNGLDRISAKIADNLLTYYFFHKIIRFNGGALPLDVIGINYYTRNMITFPMDYMVKGDAPLADNKWEIYPRGIERAIELVYKHFKKPVLITENGMCDQTDTKRPAFILSHLYYIHRAIKKGLPVIGYIYWSNLDNFELVDGLLPRFGLIYVDHKDENRTRKVKMSGEMFGKICRKNGFDQKILKEYAPHLISRVVGV